MILEHTRPGTQGEVRVEHVEGEMDGVKEKLVELVWVMGGRSTETVETVIMTDGCEETKDLI